MQTVYGEQKDTYYMQEALKQARIAFNADEVPIGAVVVDAQGEIIARAHNEVEQIHTQCAHAELLALAQAGAHMGDWRLNDCWLYVTLEPCSMCMHAIRLHRLAGVAYGADSPLFGYQLDTINFDSLYKNDIIRIVPGILQDESRTLLQQFFKQKRNDRG